MKISCQESLKEGLNLILPTYKNHLDYSQIKNLTGSDTFDFEGAVGEVHTVYTAGTQKIYLLGLGEKGEEGGISGAFRKLIHNTHKYWKGPIQIDLRDWDADSISEAVIGIVKATYSIRVNKVEKSIAELDVVIVGSNKAKDAVLRGQAIGQTINRIKHLVDAPPNIKTPDYLADFAKSSAERYNYNCTIWDVTQLEKEGLSAILAVGKGSIHQPKMIEVSYLPQKEEPVQLGLVGKGITFDSGGLSIKGAQNMHYMKSDMGGAATVLGVIELAAKLELEINIVGIIPCAENAVDGHSYRPGDVISSYSGHTIEVIDTDAEGRLILADGLNYIAKNHQPLHLIDIATLTGSVVRTLGYAAAGVWSKNQKMVDQLNTAGKKSHERVWPLPLFDDYKKEIESDVADIRNLGSKPIAGASVAATFLEFFTEGHNQWMHMDIAGVAFGDSSYTKMKSATGFGVRLLLEYIELIIQEKSHETN